MLFRSGHGNDENDLAGDLYPDQPAGHFHLDTHAADGNLWCGICLCDRVERYACGSGSVLFSDRAPENGSHIIVALK